MEKKCFTFDEIKLKLANYCIYQDRCHFEVEQKMKEFVLIPEAKEQLLLYLLQNDFLNEERFAKSYVRGKFKQKKWGKNKIKQSLKQKFIQDKLIVSAIKEEINADDYRECLQNYLEKLMPKNIEIPYMQKNKSISYLIQKGFEYELILELLKEN